MSKEIWKYIFGVLSLLLSLICLSIFSFPDNSLKIIACDVGQGDASLIIHGNIQVLIDGGPGSKVLECLGRYLPYWDRQIETVILTHPDFDHYGGLIEVFERYEVDNYLYNGLDSGSQSYEALEKGVGGGGTRVFKVGSGTQIRVGKIYLDIVSPEETIKTRDSNDNSLVLILKYNQSEAIFTGDALKETLNRVLPKGPYEYIKISHHGSKTGTDAELLDRVMPKLAVISVGKNSYGHPNEDVIKLLEERNIKTLRTDIVEDIVVNW